MKKELFYTPNSCTIFPGFYESALYNSDMEYTYNKFREIGEPECEIDDFKEYCKDVCWMIAGEISVLFDDEICDSCVYDDLWSPQYYNFTTDKITLKLNIDLDALVELIKSNPDYLKHFDEYMHKRYTSCSGYMSFVCNNADDYFQTKSEPFGNDTINEYPDAIIDYYLLTRIFDDVDVVKSGGNYRDVDYLYNIYDNVTEIFYEHLVPIDEEKSND